MIRGTVMLCIKHRVTLCTMKETMMKRIKNMTLAGLLAVSLCCNNGTIHARHDGFVEGACAVGAAILGIAGAVALADWCFSETDEFPLRFLFVF